MIFKIKAICKRLWFSLTMLRLMVLINFILVMLVGYFVIVYMTKTNDLMNICVTNTSDISSIDYSFMQYTKEIDFKVEFISGINDDISFIKKDIAVLKEIYLENNRK